MNKTLFEIGDEMLALEELIDSLDGDISDPAAEEAITAALESLAKDQANKTDGYVNLIRKWEMLQVAATAEKDRYSKRISVMDNRVGRLKHRLKQHMELTGQKKIETASGRSVTISNNGGALPLEMDTTVDPRTVDPRFQKVILTLDNENIRKALVAGEKLEFASIKPRGTHLRIN